MKRRALAVVLTLMMLVSVLPMAAFAASFSDTVGHWAEKPIDRWTEEGVLQGIGDNMFAPNEFITRAQSAAVFTRLLKLTDTVDVSNYTDVDAGSWYADYVSHAVAANIMNGTTASTFNPNGYITRQDFFVILARALGIKEQSTCNYTGFEDIGQVSQYARGLVYALINLDYVHGRSATSLQPLAYITRAEVAQVLDNVIDYYITSDGDYQLTGSGIAVVVAPRANLKGDFTGLVVAAAKDGTVDLSGLANPVEVNVVADNVNISKAPVGTKITARPGVTGTTYTTPNGTQKTIGEGESQIVQETTTPASSGGGGSSGGSSKVPEYKVDVFFEAGGLRAASTAPFVSATVAKSADLSTVASALLGGDNQDAIENAIDGILGKFAGDKTTSVNGTSYRVVIARADTSSPYTLTVYQGTDPVNLTTFVKKQQDLFENRMDVVSTYNSNVASTYSTQWNALVSALSPSKLFAETQSDLTTACYELTFLDEAGYYTVIQDIVNAFVGLQQVLLAGGWDADQFQGLLKGVNSVVNLNVCTNFAPLAETYSPLTKMEGTTPLASSTVSGGNATEIADSAADMLNDIFSRDFHSDEVGMAILKVAANDLAGSYKLSVEVSEAA